MSSIAYLNRRNLAWLLLPSLLGLFLFMVPVEGDKGLTIPVAILANSFKAMLGAQLSSVIVGVLLGSAVLSVITKTCCAFRPLASQATMRGIWLRLFAPAWSWVWVRVVGACCAVVVFFKLDIPQLTASSTGGLVFHDLLPVLFCVFLFAGLLLPLLLNFGLLELVGTLMTKIMRPVFRLPGRSAVDCLTSWIGDGSVGVLLTSKQYEAGFYTAREAAVIGTTFSAVSITFCLVVIGQVKLEQYFLPFYGTICVAGLVAALVLPFLPPLRFKPDTFIDGQDAMQAEGGDFAHGSIWRLALSHGLHRASLQPGVGKTLQEGVETALDMLFGVLPVVMAVGTLALMIAEYTPIFSWLGMPFVPLLELLAIPFADEASKAIMVGFADMFVPSILVTQIPSELTRFVIAALSVTQLIYMSEIGALLLGSKIPVTLWDLFLIYILRTLITLPVIAGMAHLIFP
jgi:nucleoside recognition membrane protein YjiH